MALSNFTNFLSVLTSCWKVVIFASRLKSFLFLGWFGHGSTFGWFFGLIQVCLVPSLSSS
jgi:hypothetical protein